MAAAFGSIASILASCSTWGWLVVNLITHLDDDYAINAHSGGAAAGLTAHSGQGGQLIR
jgi:hypothetical protein